MNNCVLRRIIQHIIILNLVLYTDGENISDVQRVLDKFFSPTIYNKMIRGVNDQTKPVLVNVTFSILSIVDLNEVEETLSIAGVLYISWIDERLVWDPPEYNGTKVVHTLQNTIWKPEVVLANPAKAVSLLGNERIMTTHYFDGTVRWSVGDLFKFYCSLDMTAFPWDHQTCFIKIMVWGYRLNEVKLIASSDGGVLSSFQDNGAWELVSSKTVDSESLTIPPTAIFSLQLRRYSLYFVVNIFIPILTLIVLNILGFLIPSSSGEKLSYCITVLLALAVFLSIVSDYLPKNSKNMASLCVFLMFILLMSAVICACSVLSVYLYHKTENSSPPLWLRKCVYKLSCMRRVRKLEEDIVSLKEFSGETLANVNRRKKNKPYEELAYNNITWQAISKFVNTVSFFITIIGIFTSSIIFAVFTLSI